MGENFTARIFKFFEPSVFFEFLKEIFAQNYQNA